MAEFKSGSAEELAPHQHAVAEGNYQPLFDSDPSEGGLGVLDDGSVIEFSHAEWSLEDGPAYLRARPLRLRVTDLGIEYEPSSPWNPKHPSLGSETELVVAQKGKSWWNILPDGQTLQWPDGSSQPIEQTIFQPEALKRMIEYGTTPVHGYVNNALRVGRTAEQVGQLLSMHDLVAPPLSVNPDGFTEQDISSHPWIQKMAVERMPDVYEFECLSVQLHVQARDPRSGARALNNYQAVQALMGLITASGPIRDGSFGTSLGQHYLENPNPDFSIPDGANDLIDTYGDCVPHDWRELSRSFGSPSSGAYDSPAPLTTLELLRKADTELRDGSLVSTVRVLGWHTDRLRLDIGTLEICNLGTAGGNLYKLTATQSLVAKFMVALQEFGGHTGRAPSSLFGTVDTLASRAAQCDYGHINNFKAAIHGKEQALILPDGHDEVSPPELLRRITQVIDQYSPVPLTPGETAELQATLQPAPAASRYRKADAEAVFTDFYKPRSPMTASEALRLAHAVEPTLPLQRLLEMMALHQAAHVRQWNHIHT